MQLVHSPSAFRDDRSLLSELHLLQGSGLYLLKADEYLFSASGYS
jgi:hypothetical protein